MTIPRNIRAIAREAYRHAVMTGDVDGRTGNYVHNVERNFRFVVVRLDDNNRWIVPVAQSWV